MTIDGFEERLYVSNYDAWRAAYTDAWDGQLVASRNSASGSKGFSGWIESRRVRDLLLVRFEALPFSGRSGASSAEYVGVQIAAAHGGESVRVKGLDGPKVVVTSSSVWDGGDLQSFQTLGRGEYFTVFLPRSEIEQRIGQQFALQAPVMQTDAPLMRVLEGFAVSLRQEYTTMQPWEFDSVRNALIELIAGLARETDDAQSSAAVSDLMRSAVCRWIGENLLAGPITSARAAGDHGISVRSLHRLFEREGQSFGAVVRSKRLSRALEDLAASSLPISHVASKWGFADTSHFCRELKRVHEITPTEYRRASQTLVDILPDGRELPVK